MSTLIFCIYGPWRLTQKLTNMIQVITHRLRWLPGMELVIAKEHYLAVLDPLQVCVCSSMIFLRLLLWKFGTINLVLKTYSHHKHHILTALLVWMKLVQNKFIQKWEKMHLIPVHSPIFNLLVYWHLSLKMQRK